jgi:hypothetical protein
VIAVLDSHRHCALRKTPTLALHVKKESLAQREDLMKRSAMLVGGVAMAVQLFGCTTGEIDTNTGSENPTWEEFRAGVHQEAESGIFIVNGDTPIENEKLLREFYDQLYAADGALIVHRPGGADAAWSATAKLNLTYCVSTTSFGSRYNAAVSAMTAATAAWEAAANVNFVHNTSLDSNCTASQTGVVFDVRSTPDQSYLARAFFPDNGRAARNVLISTSAFGNIAPYTLAGILRHELGHALGFRHEHTRPEAGTCFEDNQWRALTTYDSASVRHYPQCNGSQTGDLVLTAKDKQGIVALYGAPGTDPDPDPDPDPTQTTLSFQGSVARNTMKPLDLDPATSGNSTRVKTGTSFKVTMTGSGDPDIYVRWNNAPTTTQYNCRPYVDGPNETCDLTVPAGATTAYLSVRGYTAANYNITATFTRP